MFLNYKLESTTIMEKIQQKKNYAVPIKLIFGSYHHRDQPPA